MGVLYCTYLLYISQHFIERIGERSIDGPILTRNAIVEQVLDALDFGLKLEDVMNRKYKQHLLRLSKKYGGDCAFRILDGYVYIFNSELTSAITFYPVPGYAAYECNYSG